MDRREKEERDRERERVKREKEKRENIPSAYKGNKDSGGGEKEKAGGGIGLALVPYEDDSEEDDKKQRIINSELMPLHARWLEHTPIQRGEGGLVWRWRGLEDYSFSHLLFKNRE